MSTPPTAQAFDGALDPHEELDFVLLGGTILEEGEQIESGYVLEVLAEGTALGLTIMTGGGRDHGRINGNRDIRFWLEIDDAYKTNAAFNDAGTTLPMRVTFETNASPSRTRQRTFLVPVVQQ